MQTLVLEYSTKSTTASRSGVSASAVIEISTWFEASTGILVSCETSTGCSFTPSRFAYSSDSAQAGPDHCSPPVVLSTSQGALASTASRSTPALWIASIRGLAPGAGTSCATAGSVTCKAPSSAAPTKTGFQCFTTTFPPLLRVQSGHFGQGSANSPCREPIKRTQHLVAECGRCGECPRHHI